MDVVQVKLARSPTRYQVPPDSDREYLPPRSSESLCSQLFLPAPATDLTFVPYVFSESPTLRVLHCVWCVYSHVCNNGYETFCIAACVSTVFRRVVSHLFILVHQLVEAVVVASLCVLRVKLQKHL